MENTFDPDRVNKFRKLLKILVILISTLITYTNLYFKKLLKLKLYAKLIFDDHINDKIGNHIKVVSFLRRLWYFYYFYYAIYKSFIRPPLDYKGAIWWLDYGDVNIWANLCLLLMVDYFLLPYFLRLHVLGTYHGNKNCFGSF